MQKKLNLKIKYREALIQSVQAIVKGQKPLTQETLAQLSSAHAEVADRETFEQLLVTAVQQLHEGSIARYRLRRSEFLAWQPFQFMGKVLSPITSAGTGEV